MESSTPTIALRLREHANGKKDARFCTFLHAGTQTPITFGELYARSAAYADAYRRAGVRPGDLVLVILQHTPHLFYSYLGAILAGAVPSFMPFPSPKQRADLYWHDHELLFERIEPALIVTYEENRRSAQAALARFSIPTLVASDDLLQTPLHDDFPGLHADAGAVACLQHSSGTTGLKKGVMLTHRAILDEVAAYAKAVGFTQADSIASWLPLYHDMGFIGCFMTSVVLGTHLVALDPFEWVMRPTQLLDAIQTYRTTFTWLPNFAFSHIVNGARASAVWDLSSMRAYVNCSEPCKSNTFDRFLERFASCGVTREQLQVCYAMAENVFAVTQTEMSRPVPVLGVERDAFAGGRIVPEAGSSLQLLSCGVPIDGVEIRIAGGEDQTAQNGRIGEVCVRSPFMFEGYYKLPDKTRERLRASWYHSGDMGFVHEGQLFITGRADDMIVVNGRNYYAHEIEAIANTAGAAIPGRNVAVGVHDERADATVVVVLAECHDEADETAAGAQIKRLILESLGLAVHSVVVLRKGEMVKTTSGKISRSKNKDLYVNGTLASRVRQHAG